MKPIYLSFHVGRGGHFNNPGHITFLGEGDFQDLIRRCSDYLILVDTDEDGKDLPDDEVKLLDNAGNEMLQGRKAIDSKTGILEFDGDYNTSYVTMFDVLTDQETDILWDHYVNGNLPTMGEELKDALCTLKGLLRVKAIKKLPGELQIITQAETKYIKYAEVIGQFTRNEWEIDLDSQCFCPVSIEEILDYMDNFCWNNDSYFFNEENY